MLTSSVIGIVLIASRDIPQRDIESLRRHLVAEVGACSWSWHPALLFELISEEMIRDVSATSSA